MSRDIEINIGYCVYCKHWKEPSNKMGLCLKTINGWESAIGTMGDEEWESGIYTGPYYGCLHFEERPLTQKEEE